MANPRGELVKQALLVGFVAVCVLLVALNWITTP